MESGGVPPTNSDEYQNKGLTKWAIHKRLILKSLDCACGSTTWVQGGDS